MKIHTLPVGQLQTNCYLIEKNNECLIIDPGDDADFISDSILEKKLKPVAMLATHGHFDHVMAGFILQKNFNIPFYIDEKDQFLLDRIQETAQHFLGQNVIAFSPEKISYLSVETGSLKAPVSTKISNFNFQIIPTPGHTPGSVSFYFQNPRHPKLDSGSHQEKSHNLLFSGDLIFANGGIGRTDFSYCSFSDLQNSIAKVFTLPEDTIIFTGHGEITNIKQEKKYQI